ncbi:MAG TPA: IS110 family transposase [Solirubrobacteraceae bacterium]|nr:IS110 family transposase [Solirubrobacteraceae bacterium]
MDDIRWFAGVDWASEKHRVCLLNASGQVVGERDVDHSGTGLSELYDWLLAKTGATPGQIAVAIETPHGPVVEVLLERGFAVHAINPKQLDRFRDRFTVAGAKDDSRDAHVLGDALRTDRHALRRLTLQDPVLIELREWSRMTEDLEQERTRLANRVREQLWRYYPQALEITDDLAADWFLDVWQQVPTPAKAARISEKTIARILKARRIRRIDAAEVLRILRKAPLMVAPGTPEAASAHIDTVAVRIRLLNQQIKQAHHKLDELCTKLETPSENAPGQACEQRDVTILRSSPGIGRIVLATLLAEASEPLQRRDYHALRTLSGQAPVTRRSGKQCLVIRRRACNKRLENALYHWARVAMQHDPVSRCRYSELRRRGHSHGRALRGVGDRLLYVLCKLLERQVLYDPGHARPQMTAPA